MSETNAPALVILAAGLGSRYGGSKQIAGVGPDGEWLLEYAIHDAVAAGFRRVVLLIRDELRAPLAQRLAPNLDGRADLRFVTQTLDTVPPGCKPASGRSKPLGTAHAVWCCRALLGGPFAVINADDYYGREAFGLLAAHFRATPGPAMVGYRLDATLSSHGGVNRGVCRIGADGCLDDVSEYIDIGVRDGVLSGNAPDGTRKPLAEDTVVSLNCWGLTPDLFPDLEAGLRTFLAHAGPKDEYFLPHAVAHHLALRARRLPVLPTTDKWMGLTYPGDLANVTATLAGLHAHNAYPTPLWTAP
ncbi:MAG TPA: NTP transferase domain-containing protein [Rhodanobacteraceae bacterium]